MNLGPHVAELIRWDGIAPSMIVIFRSHLQANLDLIVLPPLTLFDENGHIVVDDSD